MATIVCVHAHPDDEAIQTGGTMARAAAEGHRVVLVVATRGEHGEIAPGVLAEGEQLGLRRIAEVTDAAATLGVHRVEFLGYVDSGMIGTPENDGPYCFWRADVDAAARRLAAILVEEDADVITIYDDHGGYGHPDHIQVHRVGRRAAEFAGTPRCFEATMNRDAIREQVRVASEAMSETEREQLPDMDGEESFGTPEALITHAVDVSAFVEAKRAALRCHPTQIPDDHFFLALDDELFATAFGVEWFIESGTTRDPGAPMGTSLFDGSD